MATYKGIGYDQTSARTRTGSSSDTITFAGNVDVSGNGIIDGNLNVKGSLVSTDQQQVLVKDNFLDLNFGYITASYEQTGLTFNFEAVSGVSVNTETQTLTFSARSGSDRAKVVASTASTISANTFAEGDIIQISDTPNGDNDGIYVVHTNAVAGTIEIKSVGIDTLNAKFALNDFTAETVSNATVPIFKVKVMALRASSAGSLEQKTGSTDSAFSSYTPISGDQTLQESYDTGNSITTTGNAIDFNLNNGNFTVDQGSMILGGSGSATNFTMDGGTLNLGQSVPLTDFNLESALAIDLLADTASTFQVVTGNLTLSTTTSGDLAVSSAGKLDLDGVAVEIDSSGAMDITAADGQTLSLNHGGGSAFAINATGQIDITSESASAFNIGSTSANLSLSTTTSGEIDLTSAGAIDLNASGAMTLDSTDTSNFTMTANDTDAKTFDIKALNSGSGSGILALTGKTSVKQVIGSDDILITNTNGINLKNVGATINEFSTDGTLGGNSDTAVPTEQAVKTYVDTQLTAEDLDFQGDAGTGSVDLDSQSLDIAGDGTNISTSASGQQLTVTLASTLSGLTEVNTTTIDVTNIRANDGTASIVLTDSSGAVALSKDTTVGSGASLLVDVPNGSSIAYKSSLTVLAGVAEFDLVYVDSAGYQKAQANSASTCYAVGVSGVDASGGAQANGAVIHGGVTAVDIPTGTPSVGDRVYLSSATAGKATLSIPTGSNTIVYQVGFVANATAIAGTVFQIVFQPQYIMTND